ncbi:carbonic anhydrase [Candidatus Thiothrix sp. Deng01]|uniref:carbonic anhydrase n=1 Tax=Candidatus Thiothrix phosphatis TaxID=3112415 RepID=A0ABU6D2K8_9GAMM|nr:carbonic anhydrase [Candidatus Thiothrix sp. Deng01]MEB4593319.1 carbonic anhydrase [Candidatus Thiothrix sp. Deng01]
MAEKPKNLNAWEALQQLRDGNQRFVNNVRSLDTLLTSAQREVLTTGQNPFAIILGCSDSRVPAELVFDLGFGSLFVIRVAGNVVSPSQIGSVEFAATQYNTRLVVVMGHTHCGAVYATLDVLRSKSQAPSRGLSSIVERISPAIAELMETPLRDKPDELIRHAVRSNIRASVSHLKHGSRILEQLVDDDDLLIVGAEYSLETGLVDFFDLPVQS